MELLLTNHKYKICTFNWKKYIYPEKVYFMGSNYSVEFNLTFHDHSHDLTLGIRVVSQGSLGAVRVND